MITSDRPRPPLADPAVLRIRIHLEHSDPPVWRTLDLRNDLTLDAVHHVLQVAFGWDDSHLHRFSLGGGPFDPASQLFLCPFDVQEGEDDGLPAADVRLDETMQEPGDVLRYVYDYGDCWELTLQLAELRPGVEQPAVAVDGPTASDLASINDCLRTAAGFLVAHPRLIELRRPLVQQRIGTALVTAVGTPAVRPSFDEVHAAVAAHRWFLDRAGDSGIPLTSAGYLTPADVRSAAAVLPHTARWIGTMNREVHTYPVLAFRSALQKVGLLRKHRGSLLLTRTGAVARRGPDSLWEVLAASLVPAKPGFAQDATLLMLVGVAARSDRLDRGDVADGLTALGYGYADGSRVGREAVHDLPASHVLDGITDRAVASSLASAALRRRPSIDRTPG